MKHNHYVKKFNACLDIQNLYLALLLLILLSACTHTKLLDEDIKALQETAHISMQNHHYDEAAKIYEKIANADTPHTLDYQLKAMDAYLLHNDIKSAQRISATIEIADQNNLFYSKHQILQAQLAILKGAPKLAIQYLSINKEILTDEMLYSYHSILAEAYIMQGFYSHAIKERIKLNAYYKDEAQIDDNNRYIWSILIALPNFNLESIETERGSIFSGWIELIRLYNTFQSKPSDLNQAIGYWQQHYAKHPAAEEIVSRLIGELYSATDKPINIALLLPFSGELQVLSEVIRNGFLAAWYQDKIERPNIKLYDSNVSSAVDLYQQAIVDGANFIVGFLRKESVTQIIQMSELPVDILTLNRNDQIDSQKLDKLYQFSLSPEDEAKQVADVAWADGHRYALGVYVQGGTELRIVNSFKQHWISLGGKFLQQVAIDPLAKDISVPVKSLLNVDSSIRRWKLLRQRLQLNIRSVERRRQDIDFIFLGANALNARQIVPQIRFFHAGDVPIYATPYIYTGVENVEKDVDINQVYFIGMPWLLEISNQISIIQDSLNRNWQQEKSPYKRLYAMGVDAYHLALSIPNMKNNPDEIIAGQTGYLSLTADNKVKRVLLKAQFIDGKATIQ